MTDRHSQPYAALRLNVEQQHKRAKDLIAPEQRNWRWDERTRAVELR